MHISDSYEDTSLEDFRKVLARGFLYAVERDKELSVLLARAYISIAS